MRHRRLAAALSGGLLVAARGTAEPHMKILLPDDGVTLPDLLASLDAAEWAAAVAALAEEKIGELALPRFELEWQAELNDPLTALGMGSAFGGGDFRPMSPANPYLETVVQKTYLRVDRGVRVHHLRRRDRDDPLPRHHDGSARLIAAGPGMSESAAEWHCRFGLITHFRRLREPKPRRRHSVTVSFRPVTASNGTICGADHVSMIQSVSRTAGTCRDSELTVRRFTAHCRL